MTTTQNQAPAPKKLRHLAGLPTNMPVVETVAFRKTQVVAQSAVQFGEIAAFIGNAGLGKSFAVDYAVRTSEMPSLWVQMGPAPKPKEVTVRLLNQLIRSEPNGPIYRLTDQLVAELAADPHIVVIDDAQNLSKEGLDQIRLLHDLGESTFPLFLAGGEGCGETLRSDPQLADRVGGWVQFRPLDGDQLHSALSVYHPFYANTSPTLIDRVDARYAHGVFRRWARLLKTALPRAQRNGTPDCLTETVARAALATLVHEREDG